MLYHFSFWYDGWLYLYLVYMFTGALNIFLEGIYLCLDVLSMLWMVYLYPRYKYFLEVNKKKF